MAQLDLAEQAQVVVIGGGIVGCSVAYHLAKLGLEDVVLLDKHQLTSGTTWHAAGLVPQMRGTRRLSELSRYGMQLYPELERETGQPTGLKQNGSLNVATNGERLEELRRSAAMARSLGVEAIDVGPDEVATLWPLAESKDIVGALYFPDDGQLNPVDITMAFAKGARQRGVVIHENTAVVEVIQNGGGITGVMTSRGPIKTSIVVNCAGIWARELGLSCGASVPLHACEHFYAITEAIEGLPGDLPVLRDPDACTYYKEDAGKLLIGAFEPVAKPWGMNGIPADSSFAELPEDLEHFLPILEGAMRLIPRLETTGIQTFFNGPESFTPDGNYLLGEAPELRNFYVAAGFNSVGIQSAAGAGMVLAEWILNGRPPPDLWDVDIRRTFTFQNEAPYLKDRVSETLGLLYAMHWPYRQYETSRGRRKSPVHNELEERGACFGELAGWERANWFACDHILPKYEYSYKRQNWFECVWREHIAVRESVGLFDQTSFAKFAVRGPDAEQVLQRLCTNNIAVPVSTIVYTQWLNEQGRIEADVTVTRLGEEEFWVITSPATSRRDFHWLINHIPHDARCEATDITSHYAVLSLMGPESRTLLQSISDDDWSNGAFGFTTAKPMKIGKVYAFAQRISYVGELGWELYVATASARTLFATIMQREKTSDLRLCGYHALNSCRMEKAYRSWGHDMSDLDTPLEVGLAFACAHGTATPFIGETAVMRQRDSGVERRLMQFSLDDPEPLMYHDEPIHRDGELAGYVTSAAYGYTLGRSVGLGIINHEIGEPVSKLLSSQYEIDIAGNKYSASVSSKPMYDPERKRLRL